ncbi:MAG: site-2 protease family protein [Desulfomonile tiedjei]|uniref:Zinc metalloprotease n=1 Tax=Desulfomonile tiedjei TaxID=2358 RepID=A0A9D6Z5P3_9BACT|nr:site-2 protease family protein [Desulfomonile tiedjei]
MASDTGTQTVDRSTRRTTQGAFRLLDVFGITITLDYSWLIIFLLVLLSLSGGYFPFHFPGHTLTVYWLTGLIATVLFFASILVHELSHALIARRSGIDIKEITLFIFGGMAKISKNASDPLTELKIAVAGPLSSFVLAIIFWAVKNALTPGMVQAVFDYLAWINVALAIFNLVPGYPLDGGRILRALVWWRTGSEARATKWASDIGKGFAWALIILGGIQVFSGSLIGGLWLLLIGMFLRGVAEGGYQEVLMRQALHGVKVREVMVENVVSVPPDLPLDELAQKYFLKYGYGGFPVVEDGKPIGIITLSQLGEVSDERIKTETVRQAMTSIDSDLSIDAQASLVDALQTMMQIGSGRLLVLEGDKMIGMITKTGLVRFLEIRRVLER